MTHEKLSRRSFISNSTKLIVVISSFSVMPCACSNEKEPSGKTIAELDVQDGKIVIDIRTMRYRALKTIGGGVKLDIEGEPKPLIVTRVSATEIAAFSSQCPHAGYEVLLPDNGVLICESGHGGTFDLRGNVTKPPPKSNLEKFSATLRNNKVYIDYS